MQGSLCWLAEPVGWWWVESGPSRKPGARTRQISLQAAGPPPPLPYAGRAAHPSRAPSFAPRATERDAAQCSRSSAAQV